VFQPSISPAMTPSALVLTLAFLVWAPSSAQQAPVASTHASPPPAALAAPISARLAKNGVRVVVGKVTLDFWWVEALPLKGAAAGASPWTGVEEGTLVGAVTISEQFRDIRGRILKPGVYTLRYGIQPENGDHLGVSPFRDFLLLSPAANDTDPKPHGHEGTVDLSKEAIGGSHPAVLSIDPPSAKENPLQLHNTQLDHRSVVMEVPVVQDGKPAGTLRFGVVLVGKIEA
jgi:hypothetical protein